MLTASELYYSFPLFDPILAIFTLVCLPLIIITIRARIVFLFSKKTHSFKFCIATVLEKYSGTITTINLLISLFIAINMAIYTSRNLNLIATDVSYYLKVNLPAYDDEEAISDAQDMNSFNSMVGTARIPGYQRFYGNVSMSRRLGNTGEAISLVYHTDSWENLLTEAELINVCITERYIMSSIKCLDTQGYKSAIPLVFNADTCTFLTSYSQSLYVFGLTDNEAYVEDNIDSSNPESSILMSYFHLGTCEESDTYSSFYDVLNAYTVGDISVCYIAGVFFNAEFQADIVNAVYVSVIALAVCSLFMVFALRGLLTTLLTVYSILVSVICAAAFLPRWGYGTFSAFNFVSIFILLGVGANAVLFFGSAWRQHVKPGEVATADTILCIYSSVGWSVLFTIMAACVSLFSKLISPVVVISQLGAFLGVAVLVFYVCFHFIIIPGWIYTASWTIPQALRKVCCCIEAPASSPGEPENSAPAGDEEVTQSDVVPLAVVLNSSYQNIFEHEFGAHEQIDKAAGSKERPTSPAACMLAVMGGLAAAALPLALLIAAYLSSETYSMNSGLPQLFLPTSNLGQVMIVAQDYRPTIFTTVTNTDSIPFIVADTFSPSAAPFVTSLSTAMPSSAPNLFSSPPTKSFTFTPSQTGVPTSSYLPTLSSVPTFSVSGVPTSGSSSLSAIPTASFTIPSGSPTPPTMQPVVIVPSDGVHTDYAVTGCWGIAWSKDSIDGDVSVSFNQPSFQQYLDTSSGGFVDDIQNLCSYAESQRSYLNINPSWNRSIDCIDSQFFAALASLPSNYPATVENGLLQWAASSPTAGSLLGVEFQTTNTTSFLSPLWVCANFSLRSYVSSLQADPSYAASVSDRWEQAFAGSGSYALSMGIPIVVGSSDFAYPLLAQELVISIELAVLISIVGIAFLLVLFTLCDVGLVVLGTLAMVATLAVTVCLHIYLFTDVLDLLDIVVLVALMSMVVDFPIHSLLHFISERSSSSSKPASLDAVYHPVHHDDVGNDEADSIHYTVDSQHVDHNALVTASEQVAGSDTKKTPLGQTVRYMRTALLGPLVLSVLSGLPLLLWSAFSLLRKTGQYIIILSVLSYVVAFAVLPFACSISRETQLADWFWRKCCGPVEEKPAGRSNVVETNAMDAEGNNGLETRLLDEEHETLQPEPDETVARPPSRDWIGFGALSQILQRTDREVANSSTKNNNYSPVNCAQVMVINESGSPLLEDEEKDYDDAEETTHSAND